MDSGAAAAKPPKRAANNSKPRKHKGAALWNNAEGWKAVDTGDELLLGAEEGGFAGLEILENPPAFDIPMLEASKQSHDMRSNGGKADDMAALKTRLSALEQENAQLKKQSKRKATEDSGVVDDQQSAQLQAVKQQSNKKQKKLPGNESPPGDVEQNTASAGNGGSGGAVGVLSKRQQNKLRALELRKAKKERKAAAQLKRVAASRAVGFVATDGGAAGTAGGAVADSDGPDTAPSQVTPLQTKRKDKRKGAAAGVSAAHAAAAGMPSAAVEEAAAGAVTGEGQPLADVSAWKIFSLQPDIERALALMGFSQPSEIQKACLPAAINARLDIIGAAQTGSGKTLAFGLPIMQILLQEREQGEASGMDDPHAKKLRALILTPTRELALQVCKHLQAVGKVCRIRVVAIVGGLAQVKQNRQLAACPQVVVATPGRSWELIRERQPHLADFSHLSFLVLDEADRMVQQGHFQELHHILDLLPGREGAKGDTYDKDFEEAFKQDTQRREKGYTRTKAHWSAGGGKAGQENKEQADAEHGLMVEEADGGVEGVEREQSGGDDALDEGEGASKSDRETEGDEADEQEIGPSQQSPEESMQGRGKRNQKQQQKQQQGGHLMQTFVFSATLTLPQELRRRLRREGGGASGGASFQNLMDRVPFRGEPKVIDLTTERCVASRLVEASVSCTDEERDEVLYYLLARHPGRTLVFMNAVSAVRRLSAILKVLGLPAHALHAQQQQRQRLKAVDRFKEHPQAILVATDVAARGLDIPDVRCVVHYQLPASADTYVHRSGRTARAGQDGLSIALVTPKEAPRWVALGKLLHKNGVPPSFPLDRTVMPEVHKRVMLAIKLDELQRAQRKQQADKSWQKTHAELIGLDLDGVDEDDAEAEGTGKKASSSAIKALQAQLAQLTCTPLIPKMSTRYFTGGAVAAVAHGSGLKAAGADNHSVVPLDTVNQAVALANRMQQSKDLVAAQQAAKTQRKQQPHPPTAGSNAVAGTSGRGAGGGLGPTSKALTSDGEAGEADGAGVSAPAAVLTAAAPDKTGVQHPKQAQQGLKDGGSSGKPVAGRTAKQPAGGTKTNRQALGNGVKKVQRPTKRMSQAELARLAISNNEARRKQRGGGRKGMVVIPAAFGREAQGADALEALRKKLGAMS